MRSQIRKKISLVCLSAMLLIAGSLTPVAGQQSRDVRMQTVQHGIASYYSNQFNGQLTSTGDVFSNKGMTAASNTLPLGTVVKVTNLRNRKWVLVRINDRMNKHNTRTIDLTRAAARELGMVRKGTIRVKVEAIPPAFYAFFHITPEELMAAIADDGAPRPETL
jgi:rare lipoprotein A